MQANVTAPGGAQQQHSTEFPNVDLIPPVPQVMPPGVPPVVGVIPVDPQHAAVAQWMAAVQPNTVYVNRHQYARIEKRRESRRVLNAYYAKFSSSSGPRRRYESRSKHAGRRPRNKRGHFMNDQELEEHYRENPEKRPKVEGKSPTGEESLTAEKSLPTEESSSSADPAPKK